MRCSSDLQDLRRRFGVLPAASFDTQIGGRVSRLRHLDLAGRSRARPRGRAPAQVADRQRLERATALARHQLEYLVDDVRYLLPLHDALAERLDGRGRLRGSTRSRCRSSTPPATRSDPERLYLRIPGAMRMNRRELGILRELAVLRDRLGARARRPAEVHRSRRRDGRDRPPATKVARDDFAQLRRMDAGVRKAYGERIVAAVARGAALHEDGPPAKPARPRGQDREADRRPR